MKYSDKISKSIALSMILIGSTIASYAANLGSIDQKSKTLPAISGSQCQAYDESSLHSGDLIRTTFGIVNKSEKEINVYCPVNVNGAVDKKILFHIKYKVSQNNIYYRGADMPFVDDLKCFLAFNEVKSSASVTGERKYHKFKKSNGGGMIGVTSTSLYTAPQHTAPLSNDPIIIKCTMRPGDEIISIHTQNSSDSN